jgi:hypothetical protein
MLDLSRPLPAVAHYTPRRDRARLARRKSGKGQMAKKSLDGRHRDTTGRIDKKHGNTRVGSLRKTYGEHFARGRRKDMMLKTLLAETGTDSLHAYLRKHHK